MPGENKIFRFWASVPTGFVEVALDEMHETLPGVHVERVEKGRGQARVFFSYERSPRRLLQLRSLHAVYAVLADMRGITVGKPGLERIASQAAKIEVGAAQRLALACDRGVAQDAFQLHATVQGNHRFGSAQVVQSVQKALVQHGDLRAEASERGLLLQLQVRGRSAVLGLRLRAGQQEAHHAIGYCLGRMVGLEPDDRVLWLRKDRSEVAELARSFNCVLYAGMAPDVRSDRAGAGYWFRHNGLDLPVSEGTCSHVMAACANGGEERLLSELARILPFGGIALVEVEGGEVLTGVLAARKALDIAAVLAVGSPGRRRYLYALERIVEEELIDLYTIS